MKIKSFIEDSKLENHTINIHNDITVEMGILNFAEFIEAGIIALNTHDRRGLMNISKDITNHSVRPVVTFKLSK